MGEEKGQSVYAGHCQACGEIADSVIGDHPEDIGLMAMCGLIVIRRDEPILGTSECKCEQLYEPPRVEGMQED